jgi:hypothetical protein
MVFGPGLAIRSDNIVCLNVEDEIMYVTTRDDMFKLHYDSNEQALEVFSEIMESYK